MENKILIITTKGCEACDIAKRNINSALFQTCKTISIETTDWHDLPREFVRANKIKDFPTVIYITNGQVVNKTCGTYPSAVYLRWIDMYFK